MEYIPKSTDPQARLVIARVDMSREELEAIAASRMSAEHDYLNTLLDDETDDVAASNPTPASK